MDSGATISCVLNTGLQGTGMLLQGSAFAVKEIIKLVQFLYKQHQKNKLSKGEFEDLLSLIKASEGNVNYLNIPAENPDYASQVKEDLDKMKIPYHVLPDLNSGDDMIQIVYHGNYKNIVRPWYENYCNARLNDGTLKSAGTLAALAGGDGQCGVITVPTEDSRVINNMMLEFGEMGVSCSLMADANPGDGTREVLYAKKDEAKVKSWLDNFCQKHVVAGGEKTYQELQNLAGSKNMVDFIAIPTGESTDEILASMKQDFELLGINYHIMPVKAGDGQTQVMYLKKDEAAVRNWYAAYATDRLIKGGEKSYQDLVNLTNGQTQLVNIPDNEELLKTMKGDFDSLHINYCIMPDLNASDGLKQVMYAGADAPKMAAWYELYQKKIKKETGEVLPDMKPTDMTEYTKSGELTVDDYLDTDAAPKQMPSQENIKKNMPLNENPQYRIYDSDPAFHKITINEKMVVANENGAFVSRIPYSRDYLHLNQKRVFKTDFRDENHNQTYIAFLGENDRNFITDKDGNPKPGKSTRELLGSYDKVTRDFKDRNVENVIKETVTAAKTAHPAPKLG